MPILLVYGIPEDVKEKQLSEFCEVLKDSVCLIKELGITKKQVSVFFPKDRLKEGLGEEIIIFVEGLFEKPERTKKVRAVLAEQMATTTKIFFSKAKLVECFVKPFNPSLGFSDA